MQLKIAIICTDNGIGYNTDVFGDQFNWFDKLLKEAAKEYFKDLEISCHRFAMLDRGELPVPDDFDACLITGSRRSVCDLEKTVWMQKLADWIVESRGRTKMIGICFGHQIIARALGSQVIVNPLGYECGVVETILDEEAQKLLKTDKDKMYLTASHYDIVDKLPSGFSKVGSSKVCDIQGMISEDVITTQCHPELSREFWSDLVPFRLSRGLMDEATGKFMKESLDNPVHLDRIWYAAKLLAFVRGDLSLVE